MKIKSVSDFFYFLSITLIGFILRSRGRLYIKGADNIPLEGGVIIAANHISYLDPPLMGAATPRRATFMARKGLFSIPLLGWFIKHYAFPVDRTRTLPSTIKEAVRRLKNGELLVIFPEGRRSETGELTEGKRGVGMVAALSKAAVVPVFISGTDKILPVGAKWLKRADIHVMFGRPLDFHITNGRDEDLHISITQKIMTAIGELKKSYADNSG
ncbi:MAG: 1-acyl-sn-glycerol-3-phosphate acyltransferase [Nitrospirae bacterium]|nr:1-acyl-sn-glycerol-3-phosphate acyltransferase [Nitrospirota bacterium]MBI4838020.1 1-acyl-sn-glycerol-3-phosphate acyltransferase [Nitrospirota bacterium]